MDKSDDKYRYVKTYEKSVIFVNTSRGEIVEELDLVTALKNNMIAGAAMDVISDEVNFNSDLYGLDNVVITPHNIYYSEEAVEECRTKAAMQVVQVLLKGEIPRYLVNQNVWTKEPVNLLVNHYYKNARREVKTCQVLTKLQLN